MEESDAYTFYETKECKNPVFENIDATYILTLENSDRIAKMDPYMFTLSKKTFIQVNKGFKKYKKINVDTTCKDILHACRNIFYNAEIYNNILVLEDDAVFINKNYSDIEKSLKNIDSFIGRNEFNVYSLGSLGFTVPTNEIFHQRFLGFMGFAQAIVYTKSIRENLLDSDITNLNHIDASFLSKNNLKYTYYKPIIVQYFEDTENMKEWGINEKKSSFEKIGTKFFIFFVQRVLRLQDSLKGWYFLYFINNAPLVTVVAFLLAIIKNINLLG